MYALLAGVFGEGGDTCAFALESLPCGVIHKSYLAAEGCQTQVGVVLTQKYAVLGARGEHAVRFIDALGYEVVYQHADICLVAVEDDGLPAAEFACGVYSGHESLRRGLLISRRAVDLAREIEVVDEFCLEGVAQLRGREIVVLDGVARAVDTGVLEPADGVQSLDLYLVWQRRRESVQIVFVRVASLGLEEELVLLLVGECAQLVLDAGAVSRADAADGAVEEGRAVESAPQYGVNFGRGIDQIAVHLLLNGLYVRREGEFGRCAVTLLPLDGREVDGAAVDTCGCAGLHAAGLEAHGAERFGYAV